jgi:hypothetical protein
VQGEGVIEAVAEKRDAGASVAVGAHDAGLVVRADQEAKTVMWVMAACRASSSSPAMSAPVSTR